uniref:Uncharacterized protein n=1 Tax=Sonderella linearis TaxID=110477 RepID=A0A1Z1MMP0_9FLOR|nr:hypothetical protein [Sonderella linearis]ARW67112.1 hypothetical protein [Sonderella linearis]
MRTRKNRLPLIMYNCNIKKNKLKLTMNNLRKNS